MFENACCNPNKPYLKLKNWLDMNKLQVCKLMFYILLQDLMQNIIHLHLLIVYIHKIQGFE